VTLLPEVAPQSGDTTSPANVPAAPPPAANLLNLKPDSEGISTFLLFLYLAIPLLHLWRERKLLLSFSFDLAWFSVSIKHRCKKKAEKHFLGISPSQIFLKNAETNKIVRQWPLTAIRRWQHTEKTFTLDFGDY
jgi:hypothetical protein